MKKTDKIVIWRKENGFVVEITDEMEIDLRLIFVYNKQRDLIEDMAEFLSVEQLFKSDKEAKEVEEAKQREIELNEE